MSLLAELLSCAKALKVKQSAMSAGEIVDTRIDDIVNISFRLKKALM
jgi:hypothetical protein